MSNLRLFIMTIWHFRPFFRKSQAGDIVFESKELLFSQTLEKTAERILLASTGVLAYIIDMMRNVANGRVRCV